MVLGRECSEVNKPNNVIINIFLSGFHLAYSYTP